MTNLPLLAVVAAFIGSGAAVLGGVNTARALQRAASNLREQLRPVVVVELRKHAFAKRVQELIVTNYGQTPARDLTLSFEPEICDPEPDAKEPTSGTTVLVRRFARTISVLAPGAHLEQIYYDVEVTPGGGTFMDGLVPEHVVVSVHYFGPDGHDYDDDFELDVHLVGLSTTVNSKDNPATHRRTIADSLEKMARTVEKRLPSSSRRSGDGPADGSHPV